MADPITFDPFLGWVDITDPNNIPEDARVIGAEDLLRYENFGVAVRDRINEIGAEPGKGPLVLNATDAPYNAVAGGTVDTTAALQAAADAALAANKILFIPPGTYRTSSTLNIRCALEASEAWIWYYGAGTALQVGDKSAPAKVTQRRTWRLPMVWNRSRGTSLWVDGTVGIELVTLDTCNVYIPYVRDFSTGVKFLGHGGGFAYNQLFVGQIMDNRVGLHFATTTTGWSSQNTVYGGRVQQNMVNGAFADDIDSTYLKLDSNAGNNTFIGTSLENSSGDPNNAGYYRVIIGGRYNVFYNCRWETKYGQKCRILHTSTSRDNKIDSGYDAAGIVEVVEPGGTPGIIVDGVGGYYRQTNPSGQLIPSGANTVITGWPSAGLIKIAYDPATGLFTPRAGTWRVRARVGYLANPTGVRRAFIQTPGGTGDTDEVPAAATTSAMWVEATYKYNGTQTFSVQTYQNSGAPLGLGGTAYNKIEAEYLGY